MIAFGVLTEGEGELLTMVPPNYIVKAWQGGARVWVGVGVALGL